MKKNTRELYCRKCNKIIEHTIDSYVEELGNNKFMVKTRCGKCGIINLRKI